MDVFRDSLVETARREGGTVRLGGGRRLLLPRVFGFCGGVTRALVELDRCVREAPGGRVLLLGPVIHNDTVNARFCSLGVRILPEDDIEQVFALGRPGDRIVIPAFGVPIEVEERLRQCFAPGQVVETTCHDVRAVWRFLGDLEGADWTVVVYGKPDHPETRATLSRARRRAARVVVLPAAGGTEALCRAVRTRDWSDYPREWRGGVSSPAADDGPVALVQQTTMLYDETMALAAALRQACGDAGRRCVVADTVCRATQERQDAARDLCAQHPDVVLVVGGSASSNTTQLLRMARASTTAYLIQGVEALAPDRVTHWVAGAGLQSTSGWLPTGWQAVGLLAGASCPASDVGAVIRWFQAHAGGATGGAAEVLPA